MVFVEIFFAEMAFAKSKDGFVKNIFVEMDLVKSRSGLGRKYLYGNCLRQVQEWSSSKLSSPKWSSSSPEAVFAENIIVEIAFVKSKNDLRRIFSLPRWSSTKFEVVFGLLAFTPKPVTSI